VTTLTAQRNAISVTVAMVVGVMARAHLPWRADDPVLALVAQHQPVLYRLLYAAYVTVLFTTPYLLASVLCALTFIFIGRRQRARHAGALPSYPEASKRGALFLVLGEQHHPTQPIPSPAPRWLTIPARGLYTGIAVIGAVGSGKTSGCLYPYAEQLLGYKADDPAARLGGLVLEVKGDFCHDVGRILRAHGREQDYVEVSLDGPWRYNPLHNDLDAYALAYGIATVINATFGKGKEPFWQQAYTNLVKFLILLHRVADDYVTLFDVYRCAIDPNALADKMREAEARCAPRTFVVVAPDVLTRYGDLADLPWAPDPDLGVVVAPSTAALDQIVRKQGIPHSTRPEIKDEDRAAQFAAVKRWYEHDWQRIEPKLRTSIVEGISVFLSLFDENAALKRVFCPPKACYAPSSGGTEHEPAHGRPLPSFAEVIDTGKVCALNFPTVSNPGLAKLIGTLMKQDFQRAVLERIPRMTREPQRHWREVLFLCDEYQAFATAGEEDPSGDDRFFALSRQGKCIAIVATQSISSLKSALPGESWRTLLQTFRTKVFLTLSDDVSARIASDLAGRAERLVPNYHLSESGQDARISMLTGRAAAHRSTISTSKSYALQRNPVFEPKVFTELKNAQAIVLAYDGASPLPPTYCYLKPRHLDRTRTWFQHLAEGKV
jgi:hypothetical protein